MPTATPQQEPLYVPGRALARFRSESQAAAVAAEVGATVQGEVALGVQMLSVPEGLELQLVEALTRNPNVEFAEPDYIRTFGDPAVMPMTDPYIGYKWDLDNDGNIYSNSGNVLATTGAPDADIDWKEAYDHLGGSVAGSAVIGIMDSGIRQDHEELAGLILAQKDFWDDDNDAADDNGHGTHVAGTAAGSTDNGLGVAGVSFANTGLVIAKVCGPTYFGPIMLDYGCASSAIASGITWAVDNGANVLNLSLGGTNASSTEQAALQYARTNDVLPFCAAGNNNGPVLFPGAFPECVAIGATDWYDDRASYSNFGPQLELSAPGGDNEDPDAYSYILSSYNQSPSGYAWMIGTSMATPQASGLAALLHALGTTDDVTKLDLMKSSADDLGQPGRDDEFGYGRINAYNAVTGSGGGTPSNNPPIASIEYSCEALACDFADASWDADGSIGAWSWEFGDGSVSSEQNPSHTYGAEGVFDVTLLVTDDDGATDQGSVTLNLVSTPETITAQFSVECDDQTCQFTNESSHQDGTNLLADWDFGDGSEITVAWSPTHTYAEEGTYEVVLLVLAEDLSGWSSTSQSVTVPQPVEPPLAGPEAAFAVDCTDLTCAFSDASTPGDGAITTWSWDFGDSFAASTQDTSHTYAASGSYPVTLTVTDANGLSDNSSQTVTVTAPVPPPPGISLNATGYKYRGLQKADLEWSGASGAAVDVYRDDPSSLIHTWANTGFDTDNIDQRGGGSYTYWVCEAGTDTCSNQATVSF